MFVNVSLDAKDAVKTLSAAVRLHHTAGVAQQSDAEKQQKHQIGQMFQARDVPGLSEGTTTTIITTMCSKTYTHSFHLLSSCVVLFVLCVVPTRDSLQLCSAVVLSVTVQ